MASDSTQTSATGFYGNLKTGVTTTAPIVAVASGKEVEASSKNTAQKSTEVRYDPHQAHQNLLTVINMLNDQMQSTQRGLGFSYDESKQAAVIKVTDLKSGEVIRQIPSVDVLRMAHSIDALKGILYNKNV